MSDGLPPPRYSVWDGLNAALTLGQRALVEIRALAAEVRTISRTPGPPGKDALQPENIVVEHDPVTRMMTFHLKTGATVQECKAKIAGTLLDRGVWKEGDYEMGDAVTWGGSLWIAQRDTKGKPEVSPDWRLAVKRGQNGKDGAAGAPGATGAKGDPGRDGRSY